MGQAGEVRPRRVARRSNPPPGPQLRPPQLRPPHAGSTAVDCRECDGARTVRTEEATGGPTLRLDAVGWSRLRLVAVSPQRRGLGPRALGRSRRAAPALDRLGFEKLLDPWSCLHVHRCRRLATRSGASTRGAVVVAAAIEIGPCDASPQPLPGPKDPHPCRSRADTQRKTQFAGTGDLLPGQQAQNVLIHLRHPAESVNQCGHIQERLRRVCVPTSSGGELRQPDGQSHLTPIRPPLITHRAASETV